MKDNTKNIFKKSVFLTIILIVVTVVAFVIVKYNVEGEKDLPYSINKILITSHVLAKDSKDQKEGVIWNIDLKTVKAFAPQHILLKIDKSKILGIFFSFISSF